MLSVVVHIAFALATFFAIVYFSQLQKQMVFLRNCWKQVAIQQFNRQHGASSKLQTLPKVMVDWPDVFLRKFANAFAISFETKIKRMSQATPINLAYIAGFHLRSNIISIKLYEQNRRKICELECSYIIDDIKEAETSFSKALGIDCETRIFRKDGLS